MKSGKLLLLFCAFGCVSTVAILFRTSALRESAPPAEWRLSTSESSGAPGPQAGETSRHPRRRPPTPATEPTSVPAQPAEPPKDPDESRQWARENPESALTWMMNTSTGPERDVVAEIVCAQIAEVDPAQAVTVAEQYAGGCSNLLENLVFQWSERDEAAARTYALAQPDGAQRDRLLGRVALTLAQEAPAAAAMLVVQSISPGEAQNEAALSVLHQWAWREPNAALAWAELFPENDLKTRALREIDNILWSPRAE
jgi:hypothetical protein